MKYFFTTYFMKIRHIYLPFLLLLLVACEQMEGKYDLEDSDQIIENIPVARIKRATGLSEDNPAPGDVPALTGKEFVEGDRLYISQLGTSTDPNFKTNATDNLYIYQYQENPDANWDQNYNFVCVDNNNALKWTTIKKMGSVGNAFSLYAMSFPGNEIKFSVAKDQTGGTDDPYNPTNLINSDILGAYHATSALFTRLRFNLFHLMCYFKVTLYVPVYKENTIAGQNSYSGYKEGAVKMGYVLNAFENFSIDWRADRSSDSEAPLTYGTGNSTSIKMYMHEPEKNIESENDIIDLENVKNYFGTSSLDNDEVRAYNFSVLFPARNSTDKTNISLCFILQNIDIDDQEKYYYFESNQITSGNYSPTQGTLQQLYLYLPRTDNKAILVGANILPWGNSSTEMTVTEEKKENIDEEIIE